MVCLDDIPSELYDAILSHVDSEEVVYTAHSLRRAIHRHHAIALYHLFSNIRIKYGSKLPLLARRLKGDVYAIKAIRTFNLDCFDADPEILVILIRLITRINLTDPLAASLNGDLLDLRLCIGPTFSPEHLEVIFEKPIKTLQYLSLRFRPYVKTATYIQFLKGAYFDSTLLALASWEPSAAAPLPTLSIVQDPLPNIKEKFAQPLVFFRLDPFQMLTKSGYLSNLLALRLRIPGRQIASHVKLLPAIDYLDLSQCTIGPAAYDALVTRFGTRLKHLVLDDCNAVGMSNDAAAIDVWQIFGKRSAMAGFRRAKEREKKIKLWLQSCISLQEKHDRAAADAKKKSKKKGRSGLATATISLRASPPDSSSDLPSGVPLPTMKETTLKFRIMPPSPRLESISVSMPNSNIRNDDLNIHAKFKQGWEEGLAILSSVRLMLGRSIGKDTVQILRFQDDQPERVPSVTEDAEGLDGLVHVTSEWMERLDRETVQGTVKPAILCLAGPFEDGSDFNLHTPGCTHIIGKRIFQ